MILRRRAERIPQRIFLMEDARTISFGEANDMVNRYAAGLAALGLGRGDRIAIFMYRGIEFIFLVLAANKLGAVWVPVNTDYKGEWLEETVNESRAHILATDDELLPRVLEVRARLTCEQVLVAHDGPRPTGDVESVSEFSALPAHEPDMSGITHGDTAAILWTSGTTGKPKGVMQSHNAWIRSGEAGNRNFTTTADDIAYNCLPLYNSAAWSGDHLPGADRRHPVCAGPPFFGRRVLEPHPPLRASPRPCRWAPCISSYGKRRNGRTMPTIRCALSRWCRCRAT